MIPLDKAIICEDCRMVTAGRTNCEACGSSAVWNLLRVLEPITSAEVQKLEDSCEARHAKD